MKFWRRAAWICWILRIELSHCNTTTGSSKKELRTLFSRFEAKICVLAYCPWSSDQQSVVILVGLVASPGIFSASSNRGETIIGKLLGVEFQKQSNRSDWAKIEWATPGDSFGAFCFHRNRFLSHRVFSSSARSPNTVCLVTKPTCHRTGTTGSTVEKLIRKLFLIVIEWY